VQILFCSLQTCCCQVQQCCGISSCRRIQAIVLKQWLLGTLQFSDILMWQTLKSFSFFSYFGFLFNFSEKNHLNSISDGTYVVLNVNPLQNKVNSTYDHCFAKGMYEFKYICNSWNFQILLLTL
jgi:hypothetical protein